MAERSLYNLRSRTINVDGVSFNNIAAAALSENMPVVNATISETINFNDALQSNNSLLKTVSEQVVPALPSVAACNANVVSELLGANFNVSATPPQVQHGMPEHEAVNEFLDQNVFARSQQACSTPVATRVSKLELELVAQSITPLLEIAFTVMGNRGTLSEIKTIRSNILLEFMKFQRLLDICNYKSLLFAEEPYFMSTMHVLKEHTQQVLLDLKAMSEDSLPLPRIEESVVDLDNASNGTSSGSMQSSASSQARVDLVLNRAKIQANKAFQSHKNKILDETTKIERSMAKLEAEYSARKREMELQIRKLNSQATGIELSCEEWQNELAMAGLDELENNPTSSVRPSPSLFPGPALNDRLAGWVIGTGPAVTTSSMHTSNSPVAPAVQIDTTVLNNENTSTNRSISGELHCGDKTVFSRLYQRPAASTLQNHCPADYGEAFKVPAFSSVSTQPLPKIHTEPLVTLLRNKKEPAKSVQWSDFHVPVVSERSESCFSTTNKPEYRTTSPCTSNYQHSAAQIDSAAARSSVGGIPPAITLQLSDSFGEILKQNRLPQGEPPTFDGSKLEEYLPFKSSFHALIGENCYSDEQRYRYLLKYTTAEARAIVNSCHCPDGDNSYGEAMSQLEARYGDPFRLAQHYIEQLRNWPVIRDGYPEAIRKLSLHLNKIRNMMWRGDHWLQLDSARELKEFAEKLPFRLRRSWAESVCNLRRQGKLAKFDDLARVVEREAEILSCPGMAELLNGKAKVSNTKVFTISQGEDPQSPVPARKDDRSSASQNLYRCVYCFRDGHTIAFCRTFGSCSLDARRDWIYQHKRCLRCLGTDHLAKECHAKTRCTLCGSQKHVRSMHEDGDSEAGEQDASS